MRNGFSALQAARHAKCEVCDTAITYPEFLQIKDLDYSVCRSFDCRRVMRQKSSMAPFFFKTYLENHGKLIRQQRKRNAEQKKHIDEVTRKELRENHEILQSVLNQSTELSEVNTHLLVIPSGYSNTMSTAHERVNQYIEHLKRIVSEAADYPDASEVIYDEHHDAHGKRLLVEQRFDENPGLRTICDRLCGLCKGGCCVAGKEHAYLSVFSMRQYMDTNPHLSAEDILALYASYISTETIQNSCINNTNTGCALPRYLRSDICNGYYCDSLKTYQKKMAGAENLATVIAVQRSYTYWNRFEPDVCNEIVRVALVGEPYQYEIDWPDK